MTLESHVAASKPAAAQSRINLSVLAHTPGWSHFSREFKIREPAKNSGQMAVIEFIVFDCAMRLRACFL
jgi:hypothetical protein